MTAIAISETILAGFGGGGNWQQSLKIAVSSLDALETADDDTAKRIFVHFLWAWAEFLGIQPDLNENYCEKSALNAGALRWLKVTACIEPALLARYALELSSLEAAKDFCTRILANCFGRYLKSWSW
jgi:DNA repair protein RecO (recombination protein O)